MEKVEGGEGRICIGFAPLGELEALLFALHVVAEEGAELEDEENMLLALLFGPALEGEEALLLPLCVRTPFNWASSSSAAPTRISLKSSCNWAPHA